MEYIEKNYKIIVAILVTSSILLSLIFLQFTVDDSYITFRYAKNFVEHGVWNWNIYGEKIEAYTNFLYAILAIIPEAIGINTPLFFKLLGIITILYLSIRLFKLIQDKIVYLMVLAFLLFNPFIYIHAYSGLETPLFMLLLFELVILISIKDNISSKDEKLYLFVLLLLPLTRPEGALFSIIGFFLLLYKEGKIKSKSFFLALIIIAIGYFLWRYQYFGHMFPNTFYIKSAHGFAFGRVIGYMINNFQYLGLAIILLLIVKNKYFKILIGVTILMNLFLYGNSDLQMNYADRFPFQTFFPFFLAAFVLVKNRIISVTLFILMAFILGGFFGNKVQLQYLAAYYPKVIQSHAKFGVALSKYKDENLTLMVGDAGMIPYFSEWHVYDSIGLANAYVAHNGFSLDYMRRVTPDLIIMHSRTADEKGLRLEYYNQQYIDLYITESQQYSLVGASKWQDDYYMLSFLKKSVPKFEEIKNTIQLIDSETRAFKISKKDFIFQKYLIYSGVK